MPKKVIITGGGTGGHIFPALSIAAKLKSIDPTIDILFVGAKGGMEMELVPRNNFPIEGVLISGLARQMNLKSILKNLVFPFKLIKSLMQSSKIIRKFKPDVVVGVGGYASGPVGRVAAGRKIPLILCEQNAYPGITNKWLASRASMILLGNEAAKKYFNHPNIKVTGNPVRETLTSGNRDRGLARFGLNPDKPVVLSLGGSLGAKTINEALEKNLQLFIQNDIQLIWQCGKRYFDELKNRVPVHPNICLRPFIDEMPDTYAAADLIISRAGGSTISEIILLSKPSVLIPSPNVAEDHQTKNARSLSDSGAALLVKDVDSMSQLVPTVVDLLKNKAKLDELRSRIAAVEKHNSAEEIAREILSVIKN